MKDSPVFGFLFRSLRMTEIDTFRRPPNAMDRPCRLGLAASIPALPRGEGRAAQPHERAVHFFPRFLTSRHVVAVPRGRKFSHSPIIQQIIEVSFHVSPNE